MTTPPPRSPRSAVATAVIAIAALIVRIAGSLCLASSGCVFGTCEGARPGVPVAMLWFGLAALIVADIVLWTIAGYRRWSTGWLLAAIGVLPVLAVGRVVDAF